MTHTASPQGKEEKKETPWRVSFTCKKKQPTPTEVKKDLLVACWGNHKMADVLYHFLFVGSWKAHNAKIDESVKTYILQESHEDIRAKLNVKISEPTLISFLKIFSQAGYVRKAARKEAQEINFKAVEDAFTNPPDKPIPGKNFSSNFSLSANLKNEQETELQSLRLEVQKLTALVHDLSSNFSLTLAHFEHELNINFSSTLVQTNLKNAVKEACEALLVDGNFPLVIGNSNKVLGNEGINGNVADRSLPCLHPFQLIELDPLCEDFAYSHNQPQPTMSQASLETRSAAVGAGYTNDQSSVKPPEKPVKGTKRTKKERVVQPALVDTSKKAVAYNEAEQQQFDWYCGCDFIHARPEQDANKKAHCGKLIAHVHSQEDMQSLADFTKARLSQQLQRDVYIAQLGNMANGDNLNAWIASKQTPQQTGKVIDFQQKTTQARPGSWRERFENDPNNGGYNDEASIEAFIKAGEEIANAAV